MTKYQQSKPTLVKIVSVMEDLGNPFEEEGTDLLVLDSKEIVDHATVETIRNAKKIWPRTVSGFR